MTRTVDLVVEGGNGAALTTAVEAVKRGRRVLVVLRSGDARPARKIRRRLGRAATAAEVPVTVLTNAEIVCVDGIGAVEAVVIRYRHSGRVCAVNASEFWSCEQVDSR